jgi:enoyl-[acyl-carrier-protein] reductase (NADH)
MKGNLYRIGDLLITHKQYHPSQDYYCKIIDIIDEFGKSHLEYNIITGYGDRNSKVTLTLQAIAVKTEYQTKIDVLEKNLILSEINPHNVHLRNPYSQIKESLKTIDDIQHNINFFEKNKNIIELREEKINRLLT